MESRSILVEGKKSRVLELEREAMENEKSEAARSEFLAKQEKKSKGMLGSLFS